MKLKRRCRNVVVVVVVVVALPVALAICYLSNAVNSFQTQSTKDQNAALHQDQVNTTQQNSTERDAPIQQIIVVLGSNEVVIKAGHYLSDRNPELSQIIWIKHTDLFEQVKWNDALKQLVPTAVQLPNEEEWLQSHINVVGHGDHGSSTIEGYTSGKLAETILKLTGYSAVGSISIVACTTEQYLTDFKNALKEKGIKPAGVDYYSNFVSVSSSGYIYTGEDVYESRNKTGIIWKCLNRDFQSGLSTSHPTAKVNIPPSQSYFGIYPQTRNASIALKNDEHLQHDPNQNIEIDSTTAFKWIDMVANSIYNSISGTDSIHNKLYKVYIFSKDSDEEKNVKEIHGINDLLKELHYYGNRGPKKSDPLVYYRFGDWVLSMSLNKFYVNVEGIIQSDKPNPYLQNRTWSNINKNYPDMRPHIGKDTFINDVIHWINGEHHEIELELENAYNAQFGLALFFSESVRCFQNHLTNMMAIQLICTGYLSLDLFLDFHPMARGNTWQIEKTGLDLLQLSEEHYRHLITAKCNNRNAKRLNKANKAKNGTEIHRIEEIIATQIATKMRAFISIKSRISNIFRTWLFLQTFDGSYKSPEDLFTIVSADTTKLLMNPLNLDHLRPFELLDAAGPLMQAEVASNANKATYEL